MHDRNPHTIPHPDGTGTALPPVGGLDAATCTCAAPGVCRHRIGLVLAYRQTTGPTATPPGQTTGPTTRPTGPTAREDHRTAHPEGHGEARWRDRRRAHHGARGAHHRARQREHLARRGPYGVHRTRQDRGDERHPRRLVVGGTAGPAPAPRHGGPHAHARRPATAARPPTGGGGRGTGDGGRRGRVVRLRSRGPGAGGGYARRGGQRRAAARRVRPAVTGWPGRPGPGAGGRPDLPRQRHADARPRPDGPGPAGAPDPHGRPGPGPVPRRGGHPSDDRPAPRHRPDHGGPGIGPCPPWPRRPTRACGTPPRPAWRRARPGSTARACTRRQASCAPWSTPSPPRAPPRRSRPGSPPGST